MLEIVREGWIRRRRLAVDIVCKPAELGGSAGMYRREVWTDRSGEELRRQGYKKITGLYDSLRWTGISVYAQIHNLRQYDIHVVDGDGQHLYSQDMSSTLNDFMTSNAQRDFIRGMHKTRMSGMTLEQMALIAILGVGAVLGLYMMGII